MKRSMALISTLLFIGMIPLSVLADTSITYSGRFQSEATSFDGRSYNKFFDVSITFKPNEQIIKDALVEENQYCDYTDEPTIECQNKNLWKTYCTTSYSVELGTIVFNVTDRETKVTKTTSSPWMGKTSISKLKKEDTPCAAADLTGEILEHSANGAVYFKKDQELTQLSLDSRILGDHSEMAFTTTLKKLENNSYVLSFSKPRSQTKIMWQYLHEIKDNTTWGTSGFMTLIKR